MLVTVSVCAGHWQNKPYPYATGETLGDGILGSLGQSTHYYWCWIAIGVCLAYILLLNIIIVILLTVLPGLHPTHPHPCLPCHAKISHKLHP